MQNGPEKLPLVTVVQRAALGNRGRAILSLVGPILTSILMSVNPERIADSRVGREGILLRQLAYLPNPTTMVLGVTRSSKHCTGRADLQPECGGPAVRGPVRVRVPDDTIDSILFARDKQGEAVLIDPDPHVIDKMTLIVPGQGHQPITVHEHLELIGKALRSETFRSKLPTSISRFAKADLLIGNCTANVWLGATVKSNPSKL